MADLSQFFEDFDDTAVKPSTGVPEPVPPGPYLLQVESSELAATKDNTGMLLKMTLSIAEGQFEGQKLFPQFNIRNKSAQAQSIGIGEFKALCIACGVDYEVAKMDTDVLNHVPFRAQVGMEKENVNPATGQPYAPRNRITKYIPRGEAGPATPAASAPAPVVAAAAAKPKAGTPWTGNKQGQAPF